MFSKQKKYFPAAPWLSIGSWTYIFMYLLHFIDGVVLIDPEYLKERRGEKWSSWNIVCTILFSTCFFYIMLVIEQVGYLVSLAPCHSSTVFITLTCAFRYGREDLDVLGLTFRKDLFVANIQAFPPVPEEKKSLTRLQERLIKKLGEHAYPFTFEVNSLLLCR